MRKTYIIRSITIGIAIVPAGLGSLLMFSSLQSLKNCQTYSFDETDYLQWIAITTLGIGLVVISLFIIIISNYYFMNRQTDRES